MKVNLPVTGKERSFDASQRIISTTDPKGIITGYNDTFFEISGFNEPELDHKNHNVVRHPDMPPAAFADLWDTVKQGQSWMGIVKNRCKNGDHYWVDAFVSPIKDGEQVIEYQSVRSQPSPERVARADAVYQRINKDKKPFRQGLSLGLRLCICAATALLPAAAVSVFAPAWTLAAIGLAFIFACLLIQWQLAPLRAMAFEAKQSVDNPLMQFIYTGRHDELGQLQLTQKLCASQLDAVVARLDYATDALSASGKESAYIAQKSSTSIQQQQRSVQEIASSIAEMSTSVQQVAQNALDTADSARAASDKTEHGRESLNTTVSAINALGQDVLAAAEVIHQLSEESQAISGVLDVIREVAEQTNMLALNAAIEAARAGEQGRGFSVVADEVRALAGRTQQSIHEIELMIEKVQHRATQASDAMQESCVKAEQSSTQTQAITNFLDQITGAIQTIDTMTAQIAAATEQQGAVAEGIRDSIESLNGQTLQAVEVAADNDLVSQNLNAHTTQLKSLVQQFR